jgi:hypothetical protein
VIPVTPTCSYFNNANIYNFDDTGKYYFNGQVYTTVPNIGFNTNTSGLCTGNSIVTGLNYNSTAHQREWQCQSNQDPSLVSSGCIIKESWCGDNLPLPSSVIPYFSVP